MVQEYSVRIELEIVIKGESTMKYRDDLNIASNIPLNYSVLSPEYFTYRGVFELRNRSARFRKHH